MPGWNLSAAVCLVGGNADGSLFGPLTVYGQLDHSVGDFLVAAAEFRDSSAVTMGRMRS